MYSNSNTNNSQYILSQSDILTQIQLISNKLSQIEDSNANLSQLINDEISQRQNLEKHSITSIDAFSGQLNILKNNYEKMEKVLNEMLNKDMQQKNKIENKSPMINHEEIKKEISQYKKEFNQKFSKIDNQISENNNQYMENFYNLDKKIEIYVNDIKNLKDFQKQVKLSIKSIKEEFQKNLNVNQNFLNDVNSIIVDFKKNMDFYNTSFNKYTNEFKKLQEELKKDKEINNNQIEEMNNSIKEYITNRNKELEDFENHLLGEYDKFINFIQGKYGELNLGVKKLIDYNSEDIKIVKEKIDVLQENNKNLRNDIFKELNEAHTFFENKYNLILQNSNK